jgi:hypothetical protein
MSQGSSLYIDVSGFFDVVFGEVANLPLVTDTVFRKCQGGKDQLYNKVEVVVQLNLPSL